MTVKCSIHEGKLDDFKRLANECIKIVKAKDTQTLRYDWFLDESKMECCILEKYPSSDGLMQHAANLGDKLGELLSTCSVQVEMYGDVSEQVHAAFGPMITGTYPYFSGT